METERKGKFTKLIYTLNPKSIVLGIDRCNWVYLDTLNNNIINNKIVNKTYLWCQYQKVNCNSDKLDSDKFNISSPQKSVHIHCISPTVSITKQIHVQLYIVTSPSCC